MTEDGVRLNCRRPLLGRGKTPTGDRTSVMDHLAKQLTAASIFSLESPATFPTVVDNEVVNSVLRMNLPKPI
jgi:hypothetical protein